MKIPANRLGLGGAALGVLFDPIADEAALAVVAGAWDAGIRAFDTSPLYGGGLSEERFGAGLGGRSRDDYFLSTKTGVSRPYAQAAARRAARAGLRTCGTIRRKARAARSSAALRA